MTATIRRLPIISIASGKPLMGCVEHTAWRNMRQRCTYRKHRSWKDYGGRGITVCARWLGPDGYAHFLADMGRKPSPDHSLDRFPNNDGDYSPDNCRWATRSQQQNNTRRTQQ